MSIRKGVQVQGVSKHQERGSGSGVSEHQERGEGSGSE